MDKVNLIQVTTLIDVVKAAIGTDTYTTESGSYFYYNYWNVPKGDYVDVFTYQSGYNLRYKVSGCATNCFQRQLSFSNYENVCDSKVTLNPVDLSDLVDVRIKSMCLNKETNESWGTGGSCADGSTRIGPN